MPVVSLCSKKTDILERAIFAVIFTVRHDQHIAFYMLCDFYFSSNLCRIPIGGNSLIDLRYFQVFF